MLIDTYVCTMPGHSAKAGCKCRVDWQHILSNCCREPPILPSLISDGEDYRNGDSFANFPRGTTTTNVEIQTTEDGIAEIVETFTLQIFIPEELNDRQKGTGVVMGSINVTTIEIKDDDSKYSAVAAMFVGMKYVRFVAVQQHAMLQSLLVQ